jgi:hypothetical protein
VALIVALAVLLGASISAVIGQVSGNPIAGATYTFGEISGSGRRPDPNLGYATILVPWVLSTIAGGLLGLWAVVQGIVAVVARRGRGSGALAIAVVIVAVLVYAAGFDAARTAEIIVR